MQKITTTKTTAGLGALLLRKVKRTATATEDLGTFTKMHHVTAVAPPQRPAGGLFAPLFATTKASSIAKAAIAQPSAMQRQPDALPKPIPADAITARQNVAADPNDTAATHREHLLQTRQAHDRLLDDMRAALRQPQRHASTGPDAAPAAL